MLLILEYTNLKKTRTEPGIDRLISDITKTDAKC